MPANARQKLYLISPPLALDSVEAFAATVTPMLVRGAASLLMRLAAGADGDAKKIIQRLQPIAQANGVALLIEQDARLAARAGADGVHIAGAGADLAAALASLKPERIVGAGLLRGRDEAMNAGEAGADYLLFGEPRPDGFVPSLEETRDRIEWWAEIFESPCVAYADALDHVAPLIAAGADFIALGRALWRETAPLDALERAVQEMAA